MAEERKLKEFWITLTVQVQALDTEQATEIANDVLKFGHYGSPWKVDLAEVSQIEEV